MKWQEMTVSLLTLLEATMGKYLNPGNAMFDSIIHSEIYVDKTGIIEPLNRWINTEDRFVCVSRARRFGKTVAAKTLCAYYDKTCDSHAMFAPFEIATKPSYEKYINTFDVIAVSGLSNIYRTHGTGNSR